MKKNIATVVTLVVLVVLGFLYLNNVNNKSVRVNGTANLIDVGLTPDICDGSQGEISDADWQKCQEFTAQALQASRNSTSTEIIRLRRQISSILQQLNDLNAAK